MESEVFQGRNHMRSTLKGYEDIMANEISHVKVENLSSWLTRGAKKIIVDVRESEEVEAGVIPLAIWISKGVLETKIESAIPDKDQEILVYCAGGTRSVIAAHSLMQMGYRHVYSLDGGINAWKSLGTPMEPYQGLDKDFRIRYQRHISISEVGEVGQRKLLRAKVLFIGAGGLGCPAALYLAAAGVGTIGIIDDDVVEVSNLQRQILHNNFRVGMTKVDSAIQTLQALNPKIKLIGYKERLIEANVDKIISEFDLVVDGCDNFQTRYLVNDACLKHQRINIHGAVFNFTGQVSVFCAAHGPCYRCLFPVPPPAEFAPSCAEAGVLGLLPGTIGLLEATQAVNILLGIGKPLIGRLMTYDALSASFREFEIQKDPNCICSKRKEITYSNFNDSCKLGEA